MSIQSSKSPDITRVVKPTVREEDIINEVSLRPRKLDDYVGQEQMKVHLKVAIEHILFYGPPGLGKTTISTIIAHEMSASIKSTSGPAIEKQSDIVSLLTSLTE